MVPELRFFVAIWRLFHLKVVQFICCSTLYNFKFFLFRFGQTSERAREEPARAGSEAVVKPRLLLYPEHSLNQNQVCVKVCSFFLLSARWDFCFVFDPFILVIWIAESGIERKNKLIVFLEGFSFSSSLGDEKNNAGFKFKMFTFKKICLISWIFIRIRKQYIRLEPQKTPQISGSSYSNWTLFKISLRYFIYVIFIGILALFDLIITRNLYQDPLYSATFYIYSTI